MVTNSLVKTEKTDIEKMPMSGYLTQDSIKTRISKMIGEKEGLKFISAITSAVNANPVLQECTNTSIFNAALLGHSLNLSPSPQLGQFYLVPFNNKNKDVKEAQFQLGYKGYIQLAIRSGQYRKLNVLAIKKGELIHYDALNEEIEVNLMENELERESAETIGYYAMFEYTNGFRKTMYWSKEKMIAHADKYSQAFSVNAKSGKYPKVSFADYEAGNIPSGTEWLYSSFWYKDFDGMAYKTMLRQLISKWGIMSIEMQQALTNDSAVIRDNEQPDYVDNTIIDADYKTQSEPSQPAQIEEKANANTTKTKSQPSLLDGIDD